MVPRCFRGVAEDELPGCVVHRVVGGASRLPLGIVWPVGETTVDVLQYGPNQYVILFAKSEHTANGVYRRGAVLCTGRANVSAWFGAQRKASGRSTRLYSAVDFKFSLPRSLLRLACTHPTNGFANVDDIRAPVIAAIDTGRVALPRTARGLAESLMDARTIAAPLGFTSDPVCLIFFRMLVRRRHRPALDRGVLLLTDGLCAQFAEMLTEIVTRSIAAARVRLWSMDTLLVNGTVYTYDTTVMRHMNGNAAARSKRGAIERVFPSSVPAGASTRAHLHTLFSEGARTRRIVPRANRPRLVPCVARALSGGAGVRLDNRARMHLATILTAYGRLCGTSAFDIDHGAMLGQLNRRQAAHYRTHVEHGTSGRYRYPPVTCAAMQSDGGSSGMVCPSGCTPAACAALNTITLGSLFVVNPVTVMFGNDV
jgi:hypothetical protein